MDDLLQYALKKWDLIMDYSNMLKESHRKSRKETPQNYGGKPAEELLTSLKDQTTPEHYS